MQIETDRREKTSTEVTPTMNDAGNTGGKDGGEKHPELKDVSGPKIDRAEEAKRNQDLWNK